MMKNKDKAVTILTKGVEFLFKKNKVTYFKGIGSAEGDEGDEEDEDGGDVYGDFEDLETFWSAALAKQRVDEIFPRRSVAVLMSAGRGVEDVAGDRG